jgi:hypothetical protein
LHCWRADFPPFALFDDDALFFFAPFVALNSNSELALAPDLSCGGALILMGAGAPFLLRSPAATATEIASPQTWEMAMPLSSTTLVRVEPRVGRQIRGSLQAVADISGRAPVGGAVARWLVEPGARVKRGQPIVEISSGAASRPAPAAESLQLSAEREQSAAVDGQQRLARQLTLAQSKLFDAQERVNSAQSRVAQTREIIQKLARGERVQSPANADQNRRAARRLAPARVVQSGPTAGEISAARALKTAQTDAAAGAQALREAQSEVVAAARALESAKNALPIAQAKAGQVEKSFDEAKAAGAEVGEARAAVAEADAQIKALETRLENANRELTRRQNAVPLAQSNVREAERLVEAERAKGDAARAASPVAGGAIGRRGTQ